MKEERGEKVRRRGDGREEEDYSWCLGGLAPLATSQSWLGGSVVERRSLIGELSLVFNGPAADG